MNQQVWAMRGIAKRFRGSWLKPVDHTAVAGVDLTVARGERVALIGESGSGKTTLARIGLGLIPADAGSIHLFGQDTSRWGRGDWHRCRTRAQILFQDPWAMLNPSMSVGVLLTESAALHRTGQNPTEEARSALKDVGLDGRFDAFPTDLSGGERRRAGIARLLMAKPKLVVADEPTAGLDAALKASLLTLLLERLGPECSVVLISHDLPTVAWATERIVVMCGGRIVDRFPTSALGSSDPRHPHTVSLLRSAGLPCPPAREVS